MSKSKNIIFSLRKIVNTITTWKCPCNLAMYFWIVQAVSAECVIDGLLNILQKQKLHLI